MSRPVLMILFSELFSSSTTNSLQYASPKVKGGMPRLLNLLQPADELHVRVLSCGAVRRTERLKQQRHTSIRE